MDYSEDYFEDVVSEYGEVFFVLDSDREYEVHGTDQYEFQEAPDPSSASTDYTMVHVEGMHDGEFYKVDFPLDAIEHHYTHREV
jgi:hypothetical protein